MRRICTGRLVEYRLLENLEGAHGWSASCRLSGQDNTGVSRQAKKPQHQRSRRVQFVAKVVDAGARFDSWLPAVSYNFSTVEESVSSGRNRAGVPAPTPSASGDFFRSAEKGQKRVFSGVLAESGRCLPERGQFFWEISSPGCRFEPLSIDVTVLEVSQAPQEAASDGKRKPTRKLRGKTMGDNRKYWQRAKEESENSYRKELMDHLARCTGMINPDKFPKYDFKFNKGLGPKLDAWEKGGKKREKSAKDAMKIIDDYAKQVKAAKGRFKNKFVCGKLEGALKSLRSQLQRS